MFFFFLTIKFVSRREESGPDSTIGRYTAVLQSEQVGPLGPRMLISETFLCFHHRANRSSLAMSQHAERFKLETAGAAHHQVT